MFHVKHKQKYKNLTPWVTLLIRDTLSAEILITIPWSVIIIISLYDEVLSVHFTSGNDDVVIAANNGRMIRFNENEIRVMGRTATGVKGIELIEDCYCVGI